MSFLGLEQRCVVLYFNNFYAIVKQIEVLIRGKEFDFSQRQKESFEVIFSTL
jgi:hypothetical protein